MSTHLERVELLLQQSRYDMAETECRRLLGQDPNDPGLTAMLAIALSGQEKYKEATEAAKSAISLAPDWDYAHYVLAIVFDARDRIDEAEKAVSEAICLEPEEADYFALLADLHAQRKHWAEGLSAAEQGLALDAEHVQCANIRAMCLVKLGRKMEADQAIASALAREPENATTHANRGWTLLESGDHQKAMEHFREALRLDPEMEWAKAGIVEAMKSRRLAYRLIMKYFFFMSRLSSRTQFLILIGALLLVRILNAAAKAQPSIEPVVRPILLLYVLFVLFTWTAQPLFNLLLRMDKFGRHALSRDQTRGANMFGLCLACAGGAFLCTFWISFSWALIGAIVFASLVLPTAAAFNCTAGWPRWAMSAYALALAAFGIGSWAWPFVAVLAFHGRNLDAEANLSRLGLFGLGIILSTWIGPLLGAVTPKR